MRSQTDDMVRLRRCVLVLTVVAVAVVFLSRLCAYDLWWHLTAGAEILRKGAVPRVDPFSCTAAGRPWTYHSWLAGVILSLTHRWGGTSGLVLLRVGLMTVSLMLMWGAARRRGVGAGLASLLVLAACLQLRTRALMRPYLFSMLLFSIFYMLLQGTFGPGALPPREALRRRFGGEKWFLWGGGGRLILLPALTVLWANLHGGFLVGLLCLGAFGAGEALGVVCAPGRGPLMRALLTERRGARFRALLVAGVLCLAAGVVTPYGPDTLTYPFRLMATVKLVRRIVEWRPTPWTAYYGVFWLMAGLGVIALALSVRQARRAGAMRDRVAQFGVDAFLLLGLGLLAIRSLRNLAWPLLLAAPVLGYHITAARAAAGGDDGRGRRRERIYMLLSCCMAVVLCGRQALTPDFGFGVARRCLPVDACDFIEKSPDLPGQLYNVYEWGGYAIWRLWPGRRVFIDGRCLVFRDDIMGAADTIAKGLDGWEALVEKHHVATILVSYNARDSAHFFREGRWHCVYWDDLALVAISEEALRGWPATTRLLDLSNPVMFEQRLLDSSVEDILNEVRSVLADNPQCRTAWAQAARCYTILGRTEEAGQASRRAESLQ